jgi:hypothetical protein
MESFRDEEAKDGNGSEDEEQGDDDYQPKAHQPLQELGHKAREERDPAAGGGHHGGEKRIR